MNAPVANCLEFEQRQVQQSMDNSKSYPNTGGYKLQLLALPLLCHRYH